MAKAALGSARTHHQEAQIGLKAVEAEDRLAEAKLAQAKLDLARAEILWNKRSISKEQYDRAITQNRVLTAQRLVTQARIGGARRGSSPARRTSKTWRHSWPTRN